MEIIQCAMCWKQIKKKNSRQKYCIKCWNISNREKTKQRYKEKER